MSPTGSAGGRWRPPGGTGTPPGSPLPPSGRRRIGCGSWTSCESPALTTACAWRSTARTASTSARSAPTAWMMTSTGAHPQAEKMTGGPSGLWALTSVRAPGGPAAWGPGPLPPGCGTGWRRDTRTSTPRPGPGTPAWSVWRRSWASGSTAGRRGSARFGAGPTTA